MQVEHLCYCSGMSEAAPVLLRARLTAAEYLALRQLALARNESVADTVGHALRRTFPTITERKGK